MCWRRGIIGGKKRCRHQLNLCLFHNPDLALRRRNSELPGVAGEENGYLTGSSRFPFPIFPSFAIFYQKKEIKVWSWKPRCGNWPYLEICAKKGNSRKNYSDPETFLIQYDIHTETYIAKYTTITFNCWVSKLIMQRHHGSLWLTMPSQESHRQQI